MKWDFVFVCPPFSSLFQNFLSSFPLFLANILFTFALCLHFSPMFTTCFYFHVSLTQDEANLKRQHPTQCQQPALFLHSHSSECDLQANGCAQIGFVQPPNWRKQETWKAWSTSYSNHSISALSLWKTSIHYSTNSSNKQRYTKSGK